jgi:hypothetical protein
MNRSFHRPAIASLIVLAVGAAAASGCAPDNDVTPGAPKLMKFIILQQGHSALTVDSSATNCAASATSGAACIAADDPNTPDVEMPDGLCQQLDTHEWCHCDASGASPMWACEGLSNVRGVVSIFDRLLDPTPLAVGPPVDSGSATTVTGETTPGGTADLQTDYASNGSAEGLLMPFVAYYYYDNFRFFGGPSLLTVPKATAFPSSATVMMALNAQEVRAKDGTPFTGAGLLQDGMLSFTTAKFAANPMLPDMIAADQTELDIVFTNAVDPATIEGHISAVSPMAGLVPITTGPVNSSTIGVKPVDKWPPGPLTIVVDASTPDVLGEVLGTAVTATVTVVGN